MPKKWIWNPWELSSHSPQEIFSHSDKPSLQSFFLQKQPLTMFPSDLNEFSLQDFLFRWHYQEKLPYTITCGQWRLTGLSQTVSDAPRTGKHCLELTLWGCSHLHLPACWGGSAGVPCPVLLGAGSAAMAVGNLCCLVTSRYTGLQPNTTFLLSLFLPLWCYFATFIAWIYHPWWQSGKGAPQECSGLWRLHFTSFGHVHSRMLSSLYCVTQNSVDLHLLCHSVSTTKLLHTENQASLSILLE